MITVITICFNAEQFIERTLQCVVNQSYGDYEYLIQDGGSTDGTMALVEKYRTDKFSVYSEKDKGIYDALNKAVGHARGDYVCFLHAGDVFYNNDTLKDIFEKVDNPDFIYGDTIIRNEKTGMTRSWYKRKPAEMEFSYKSFLNGMVVCHQSMIVKRDKCQPYTVGKWKIANDLDWTIRTLKQCNSWKDVGFPIAYFLEGGVSDQRRKQALKERFQILRQHFGLFPTLLQHVKILIMAIFRGSVS
ncbi:MAG: glycosyltransferase family 2 protein [Saprospiraceae bacterium]